MASGDLELLSLRGGLYEDAPPSALKDDQCAVALNVEWFYSMLGERRQGCEVFDISESDLADEGVIVHMSNYFPAPNMLEAERMFVAGTEDASTVLARWAPSTEDFSTITMSDEPENGVPELYQHQSVSFDDYWFHAYKSAVNRMHLWDGTTHMRTGLAEPDAPMVADHGSGSYTGIRYFRVRFISYDNTLSIIRRRSEPSETTTFTPSGSGDGATITMPTLLAESENKWEIEASYDNANFYVIQTLGVATTTYLDTTADPLDYADGVLSEAIGDYELIPSGRFVVVEGDRLIIGGSFDDALESSRVRWTPRRKDPGVGNSERLPARVDNFKDLDSFAGGGLTGLSNPVDGVFYAFKWSRTYRFASTGDVDDAYDVKCILPDRGALEGSIISGHDEYGRGCVYYLDPSVGPCRIGVNGPEQIRGLRRTWKTVNARAERVQARAAYYPDKEQIIWWVPVDGEDRPSLVIRLQTGLQRGSADGVEGGLSLANGDYASATAAATFLELTTVDGSIVVSYRPYIGRIGPVVLRTDMGYQDDEEPYRAVLRTRAFMEAGVLNEWAAIAGALLAEANDEVTDLRVRIIRDFGLETHEVTVDLSSEAIEEHVIKKLDNFTMREAGAMQIEFADPPS